VFDQHLNTESGGQYSHVQPLEVSRGCRSFGVIRDDFPFGKDGAEPQPSDMFFFSADADGLKPTAAPGSLDGWRQAMMFGSDEPREEFGDPRLSSGDNVSSEGSGCVAPAADSASHDAQPPVTGPPRPVGLGAFWEPEQRWKSVGSAVNESEQGKREGSGGTVADNPPCTDKHPCPVQNYDREFGSKLFEGFNGMPGWTDITRPRGVRRDDRSFDSVDNELVYTEQDIDKGTNSAWCRKLNSKVVCLEMATGTVLSEEQTEIDLRSNTGRFIFDPRGAARGFHVYDLSTMRDVTPRGPELVVSTHQAEFSLDDKRLFVTLNGRLLVFTPSPGVGDPWQQLNEGVAAQVPALSGNTDDKVAGLLALDDNDLVVVRGNGLVSRFNWRTGQQTWGRTVGGVGEVYRAVVSRNRRFLLVVGRAGARLLDTADGLVLSGVLVPPPLMEGSIETVECFNEVFVTDAGAVEVPCGEKEYRREQVAFGGDVRARLREILSDESEAAP
jgi:hypothetical protein